MTNPTETATQDLTQDELDTVVAGETSTAPVRAGFGYAALTVGGVSNGTTETRLALTA